MIDRARPGLVALYDIRPGNGAGPFLQPRSPYGASADQHAVVEQDQNQTFWFQWLRSNISKPF